jgi:WD40 repeat protein
MCGVCLLLNWSCEGSGPPDIVWEREADSEQTHAYAPTFFPDGSRLVTGGTDRFVRIWNVADGSLLRTLDERFEGIVGPRLIAISPDGTLLAAARNMPWTLARRVGNR